MVDITRRRLLAGGGAAVAAGAYGASRPLDDRPDADFASWTPAAGTWPLEYYDPANTAHNPHADPPRGRPELRELGSVEAGGEDDPLLLPLAGPEHLAVFGDRLAAIDEDGATAYRQAPARHAGFGPDGQLAAARKYGEPPSLALYDGFEEVQRYPISYGAEGLTIGTEGTIYVPTNHGGVYAFDRNDGHQWTVPGEETALVDGRLYSVEGPEGAVGYSERGRLDRWLSTGPRQQWQGPDVGYVTAPPAVADGRIAVGTMGSFSVDEGNGGPTVGGWRATTCALAVLDADTGEPLWDPIPFGDGLGDWVHTPAVDGSDGYLTVHHDDEGPEFVARYDLETGEEL